TLTLGGATAGATTVSTGFVFANPLAIVSGAGADITLAAPLTSNSLFAGPTLTLSAGANFVNTAGSAALAPGAGVWRVYSTDPTADSRGGLVADFKQYDASYGVTPVLGSGDGFLHRIAPLLTPTLSGAATKVYDGNTSASLASASVGVSGAIDGDSATLAVGSASFDTRHAGSGKLVSVPVTLVGASNGAIPVYGYTLAADDAAAAIGSITPAALTLGASADTKVYDGRSTSTATPTVVSGLVAGDSVGALTQAFDSRNAGPRTIGVTGYTVNDGNGGANYSLTTIAAPGTIVRATLVLGAVGDTKVYDGDAASTGTPIVVSGLVAGDSVGALSQAFDSRNAGTRSIGVSGYALSDGNGGANYTVLTNPAPGTIVPAPLTISADDKSRDTTQPNPPLSASYAGFISGETAATLGGILSLTTPADAISPPGLYSIVPAGQSSQNYAIRYVNGTLTVLLAPSPPLAPLAPLPPLAVDAVLAIRDTPLSDLSPAGDGAVADGGECRPPGEQRLCVGWPVCQVTRPICEPGSRKTPEQ
ncbi:MAG: YDG domain-containing protein, partial [Caldimonas sp.]